MLSLKKEDMKGRRNSVETISTTKSNKDSAKEFDVKRSAESRETKIKWGKLKETWI